MTTNTILKIVLDTNMFISGILYHGIIRIVLDLVLDKKIELYVSSKLQKEVLEKLRYFGASEQAIGEALLFLEIRGIFVTPKRKITVCRDPKDNYLLELSEEAQANYLITRDKDLLELSDAKWKNTKIIKPEEFLPFLRSLDMVNK